MKGIKQTNKQIKKIMMMKKIMANEYKTNNREIRIVANKQINTDT